MNEISHDLRIFLSTTEGYYPVKLNELVYCEAENSYTRFYLADGRQYLVSRLLKEFEAILAPYGFFRIHKSYLININHIEKIVKTDGMTVVMSDRKELPVSFRKKEYFVKVIRNFHG